MPLPSAWLGSSRPHSFAPPLLTKATFKSSDARPIRSSLLSTRDAATPARRLYHSLGFEDLLTGFLFPGGGPAYAVMGATLPLAKDVAVAR